MKHVSTIASFIERLAILKRSTKNMPYFILFAFLACLISCKSNIDNKVAMTLLTDMEVKELGFKTKDLRVVEQSEWDQEEFGHAQIEEQDIKALNPLKEHGEMFPRFTIIRETYNNSELAAKRANRLRDHEPGLDSKVNSGLVLRDGFAVDDKVWIITTDVSMFSYTELDNLTKSLRVLKTIKMKNKPLRLSGK